MPKVKLASGKVKHYPYTEQGKKEAMMMKHKEMNKMMKEKGIRVNKGR